MGRQDGNGGRGGGRGRISGGRGRGRGRGMGRGVVGPRSGGVSKKAGGDASGKSSSSEGITKHRSLKNQIRGIERLLRKEDLSPWVRASKEVDLADLREALTTHQRQELERKYAIRYHKIKFFERVKLERSIKKLERMLRGGGGVGGGGVAGNLDCSGAGGGDADGGGSSGEEGSAQGDPPLDPEAARVRLVALKEDLMYVMNFPKAEKYVSILRNVDDPEAQKHLEEERERLRAIVRREMAAVAAVTEADEGRALLGDNALACGNDAVKKAAAAGAAGLTAKVKKHNKGAKEAEKKSSANVRLNPAAAPTSTAADKAAFRCGQQSSIKKGRVAGEEEEERLLDGDDDDVILREVEEDTGGGGRWRKMAVAIANGDEDGLDGLDDSEGDDDGDEEEEAEADASGSQSYQARLRGLNATAREAGAAAVKQGVVGVSAVKRAREVVAAAMMVAPQQARKQQLQDEVEAKRPRHAFVGKLGSNSDDDEDDDFFLAADEDGGVAAVAAAPYKLPGKAPSASSDDDGDEDGYLVGGRGKSWVKDEEGPDVEARRRQPQQSQAQRHTDGGGRVGGRRGGGDWPRGSGGGGQLQGRGGRQSGRQGTAGTAGGGGADKGGRSGGVRNGFGGRFSHSDLDLDTRSRGGGSGGRGGGGRRGGQSGGGRTGTPPLSEKQPVRTRADGGRKRRK